GRGRARAGAARAGVGGADEPRRAAAHRERGRSGGDPPRRRPRRGHRPGGAHRPARDRGPVRAAGPRGAALLDRRARRSRRPQRARGPLGLSGRDGPGPAETLLDGAGRRGGPWPAQDQETPTGTSASIAESFSRSTAVFSSATKSSPSTERSSRKLSPMVPTTSAPTRLMSDSSRGSTSPAAPQP